MTDIESEDKEQPVTRSRKLFAPSNIRPGTPQKFRRDIMIAQFKQYFDRCAIENEPLTITGLALSANMCELRQLHEYQAYPEYTQVIKQAKLIVEHSYEKDLRSKHVAGSIFVLKNLGWIDKSTTDDTVSEISSKADLDEVVASINTLAKQFPPLAVRKLNIKTVDVGYKEVK